MDDSIVTPEHFARLRVLLHGLPNAIPDGSHIYRVYKPTPDNHAKSDGTYIGALHVRMEQLFGATEPIVFKERGEGLTGVVDILQDAYLAKDGDKRIVRRWVQKLGQSSMLAYKKAGVEPLPARRQPVQSERAALAAASSAAHSSQTPTEPAKRKADATDGLTPNATAKKAKATPGAPATGRKPGPGAKKNATTAPPAKANPDNIRAAAAGATEKQAPTLVPAKSQQANAAPPKQSTNTALSKPSTEKAAPAAKEKADKNYKPPRRERAVSVEDSEEESVTEILSDGESALRAVEAAEKKRNGNGGRRGRPSTSLKFWSDPAQVVERKSLRWEFKCKLCGVARTMARTKGCNTFDDEKPRPPITNLTSHIKDKHPNGEEELSKLERKEAAIDEDTGEPIYKFGGSALMEGWLEKGKLNPEVRKTYKGFLRYVAAWIVDENLPFTTGESLSLKSLFHYLDVHYALPSDTTVRNELARLYADLHGAVVKELAAVKSRIAYATDTWTPKQMTYTFAGTIASFINDDWALIERVIDFACLAENQHEGVYAAQAFVDSATERGVTMDNASVNDVMARSITLLILERYGVHIHPDNTRIRCMPHVVNIVVQKMLASLLEADDPDKNDYFVTDKNAPIHYDPADDAEQLELESQEDNDITYETTPEDQKRINELLSVIAQLEREKNGTETDEVLTSPVKKLRTICTKIVSSPQRRAKFRRYLRINYPENIALQVLMVVRDVATRWNFTHAMMDRALRMMKAIDDWVIEHRHELGADLYLSRRDWETIRHMRDLLGIFPDVTKYMSQSGQPTLPWVLPLYHYMETKLKAKIEDEKLSSAIRSAAAVGLAKLSHYHDLAKKCQYNWLATLLHPALRNWFHKHDLGDKASAILKHAFDSYREEAAAAGPVPTARMSATGNSMIDEVLGSAVIDESELEPLLGEIERYMRGFDMATAVADNALTWWKKHERDFPILARMARDFLAIPASSVSVERLFSDSGYLVTKQRSSLSPKTIRECMCTKRWIRDGLMGSVI